MKNISDFPVRESAPPVMLSIELTYQAALLVQEMLRKTAAPLAAARHLIGVMDQVDKVVATLSPE